MTTETQNRRKPPRPAERILRWIYPDGTGLYTYLGDIEEAFNEKFENRGVIYANIWYWSVVLVSLPSFLTSTIFGSAAMVKNYLKILYRNILKQKLYSIINITGLAIGITCCIFILAYLNYELSYDRYHENSDNIYRVCSTGNFGGTDFVNSTSNPIVGMALFDDIPEVVNYTRIQRTARMPVRFGEKRFYISRIFYADQSFLDIFSFRMIKGDRTTALTDPNTVVITEDMAARYFGDEDPLNKVIEIADNSYFTVTGVIQNVPENSHFLFTMLLSFETQISQNPQMFTKATPNWGRWTNYTYILLEEGYDYRQLDLKINDWAQQFVGPIKDQANIIITFFLQPLTSIHLNSDLRRELRVNGSIGYIYAFALTAAFILLIACINFMNLSTARSSKRAREVGMRKVFGAYKRQLIAQFLGESFLYTLISLVLAMIMIELLEPLIKVNFNSNISVNYTEIPVLAGGVAFILIFVGFFAGSYPAFFLSKFNSINVLKGNLNTGARHSSFRKILVTSQFAISICLIVGTGIILNQVKYMKNIDLGFNKEQLLILPASGSSPLIIETAKNEMLNIPGVIKAAKSNVVPGRRPPGYGVFPEGHEGTSAFMMEQINIEPDFLDTYQMEIAEGRGFSEEMITDTSTAFLVNETAVEQFGWTDPIGKKINSFGREYTVIGVLKDFHQQSLHYRIEGTLFRYFPHSSRFRGLPYGYITLKVSTENITGTMQKIEDKYRELYPDREYSYFFLDENYDMQYAAEDKLSQVIELFTGLAIFIGCLGLFGLASFTAQQRTREIGIRKVLGSTISEVTILLYREFIILIVIAVTIAWPLTYFFMNGWIQSFAYQSMIGISVFIFGALLAVLIALVTVSYQSIKAAMTNPVDTLRYE